MKFKIKHTYETLIEKSYVTEVEIDDREIIYTIKPNARIYSKLCVKELLNKFINNFVSSSNGSIFTEIGDIVDGNSRSEICNIDEVVDNYYPILTTPKSCCDDQTGNYCSICGKKLR